jgi:hypothetical protein
MITPASRFFFDTGELPSKAPEENRDFLDLKFLRAQKERTSLFSSALSLSILLTFFRPIGKSAAGLGL